jgi:predicted nucleic acid-binding protein
MIYYPDTSFLCSMYRTQEHSALADRLREEMGEQLHYTSLLEFEFLQAIELQVWLHKNDKSRGYSRREADHMIRDWESDTAAGLNQLIAFDMDAVLRLCKHYSLRLTANGCHRTMDMFHVATAIHLGAKKFLTFDDRQKRLAEYAGLEIPV